MPLPLQIVLLVVVVVAVAFVGLRHNKTVNHESTKSDNERPPKK